MRKIFPDGKLEEIDEEKAKQRLIQYRSVVT